MNALSTSTTFCPSSFQLRLALNCRRYPLAFVRARFPDIDRRSVNFVSLVVRSSTGNGNGVGQRNSGGTSWTNLNASANEFSGWGNADAERDSGDSEPKKSLIGKLGERVAWFAKALLFIGLITMFISFEKHLVPLLTQQEKPLPSDNENQVEEESNAEKVGILESASEESKTGTNEDLSLYKEKTDEAIENRMSGDIGVRQSSEDGGVSNPEIVQGESAIMDSLVSPEDTDKPSLSETTGSSLILPGSQSDASIASENYSEPAAEELADVKVFEPSVFDANSENLVTDNPNEASSLNELENSNSSPNPSSVESSVLNGSVKSDSIGITESNTIQEDFLESGDVLSSRDIEQSKELLTQDVGPGNDEEDKSPVGKILNENVPTGSPLVPEKSNQSGNECLVDDYNDINVRGSFFETTNPGIFFTSAGIPAPSVVSAALQAPPGEVLVPAVVDQLQSQALSALQVLKVIEDDARPGELCTRREYARWLVLASGVLSRNTTSKVYPAMYIENVSELAFDDITPEDPDFSSIQGLAEAGLIASKLSRRDMQSYGSEDTSSMYFSPESLLSRQDLVSWKMALEKKQLPVVDKKTLQQLSGFIDIDKINPDAWPALVSDLSAGDQGITTLAFGYTRLFQPEKPVTKAQAAIALSTGDAFAIVSEELARIEAESMAEKAVAAHSVLVAQVEKDVNANYEKELSLEREKINAVEKLAEETKRELEELRAAREKENLSLMKERAAVDSEMEVLSRLRREMEEQLQTLMTDKLEISYEKERLNKLRRDSETENQEIVRLQYELEVERKALSMARSWAEDEAKRAREQAKALDEARNYWQKRGLKVVVDDDLLEETEAADTWLTTGQRFSVDATIERSENLLDKLKRMAGEVSGKCKDTITRIIEKIASLISNLREKATELGGAAKTQLDGSLSSMQQKSAGLTSAVKEGAKRVAEDCKEGVERLSQRFKT